MPALVASGRAADLCMARRQTAWGPRLLTVRTGHPHSTISNVLKRNGLSQPPRVARALSVFAARGVAAKRLLTDNAWAYTRNRSLRELLAERGVRHLTTGPRRPRTNANWLTASATAPLDTAARRCHTGSATTTSADRTARSAACPRSAAFTTSMRRTASGKPTTSQTRRCSPANRHSAFSLRLRRQVLLHLAS
jgi:hypothetical protein